MFTDMVGFTALTQSDEAQSLAVLERHNKMLRPIFPRFHGREVKTIGDSFLVEFDSALDAVSCAVEVQSSLHDYNISSRDDWKVSLRIGIHLGDVVHSEGDVFGDAVNIASRLQPLAEPGGVCLSEQVYDQVRNKLARPMVKLEPQDLKGVKFPIGVYRVVMPWDSSPGESAPRAGNNRVAILPFANMSPDPNDEYFADGMTEELIDKLAQVKEIEVIARTSVMSYKRKEKKISEIAMELGAGNVVEGSVRKAGNRVRVTAQLINGATQGHLWSAHYDGNLDDIFAVQSEIAEKVAGELKVRIVDSEKKTMEKKPTQNMESYGLFLKGKELERAGGEANMKQALRMFEKAVELDPAFARAHVAVAEEHQNLSGVGYESSDVMFPAVRASLKRALELDPGLPEAHAALALLRLNEDDLPGTEMEARKALELNPSLPEAYVMLAEVEGVKGNPQEMLKNFETAYNLDPLSLSYIGTVGMIYFRLGMEKQAWEHTRKTEIMAPVQTYRNLTDYYLEKGDIEKAREMHSKFAQLRPTSAWVVYMGGFIDAAAGEREKALQAIKMIDARNMGPIGYNQKAFVYHALGDMDSYFENLNKSLDEHALPVADIMYSPLLRKAREDPRYKEILERMRKMNGLN